MVNNMMINAQIEQDKKIFGTLNQAVEDVAYVGGSTNTATVNINDKIITVDAKIDTEALEEQLKIANNNYQEMKQDVPTMKSDIATLKVKVDNIGEEIEEKLEPLTERVEVIEDKIDKKGGAMYYDASGELDPSLKPYWYMSADITDPLGTVIAGPYDFGTGGGGGGSISKVTINALSWPTVVTSGNTCVIAVNWTSLKDEVPTGTGTISVYANGSLAFSKKNVAQGNVELDITEYLTQASNTIEVRAVDRYGSLDKVINSIDVVEVKLTSDFDTNKIYNDVVNYICTPRTAGTKTVYYYLDGVKVGEDIVTTTDQITKQFSGWSHGDHVLEVYFTVIIGGETVESNHLTHSIIYAVTGVETPIIASTFSSLTQEQYISFSIPYRVYTPGYNTSHVQLLVDNEIISEIDVPQDTQKWEYKPNNTGTFIFKIKSQEVYKEFNVTVQASEIPVTPVTSDLTLSLNTIGRSNAEPLEDRIKWEDKDRSISCTLSGFNWASDGWLKDDEDNTILRVTGAARVDIPYKVFDAGSEIRDTGKTIELEIATSDVMNYESVILSCWSGERGFYITPQLAVIKSQSSYLQTQYKEDDHVRLTFVIEKKTGTRLILMYINGIMSGAVQYPTNDDFSQNNPVNISIGSDDATIDIYNIRIYDNNLDRKQVVNNWIADTQSAALKKERYLRNDNFNSAGEIDIEHVPSGTPYIVWDMDVLPTYKGDKRPGNVEYVDSSNDSNNFKSINATYNVQGTSSAVYPVKNIRIKYKKNKDWPDLPFTWTDKDGNTILEFKITDGGIGDNYFTYKVDFASSEGANNVELTKLYNEASLNYGIKTPPQAEDSKIRVGIDGFPIVAFHKDADDKISFCTKANFNNDKANEGVYGFEDGDESWEITNNTADEAKFKIPVTAETFSNAFEIRFPDEDGYAVMDKLMPMTTWVSSTYRANATEAEITPITFTYTETVRSEDGSYSTREVTKSFNHDTQEYRLTKFKAELKDWFNVNSTLFYYLFTHQYLMIDSRAKNAFPTYFASRTDGDGGDRWFWLPYDMDTAIGIDNKGKLSFDYNLEDTDKVDGADVFNGQDSVMWNNVRDAFDGELGEMYSKLRTQGLFSYDITESRFETHQGKWSENIFNEDSKVKYIDTLASGDNYLEMLQGGKVEQRKWWLYNRFKYMDSKYTAGDAKEDFIQFRAYVESGVEKPSITITPYADIYATVSYANGAAGTKSKRATRGEAIVIENPFSKEAAETDQETYIYSASQLKSIGDISPFKPDTVKVANAVKLQELKVGSSAVGYTNPHLTELTLGNNKLLKLLDVRNCINLTNAISVKNCTNIEEVYFDNTQITELELPDGGILKKLHLPNTITTLILKDQPLLEEFTYTASSTLQKLWLENIDSEFIDAKSLINNMAEHGRIRIMGFNMTADSYDEIKEFYDKLDTMSGIDAQGGNVDKAQIEGNIYINEILYSDYIALKARYKTIDIIALTIICKVNFYNEGELYNSQNVKQGESAVQPADPTKPSTAQYYYTFEGWNKSFENVQTDLDISATYSEHIQVYEITFDTQTTLVHVDSQFIEYGNKVTKPTDPAIPGTTFLGWFTEPNCVNLYDFDTTVTHAFTLYASWRDDSKPSVSIARLSYNKFKYTLTDNIAVTAYAITNSEEYPTSWTEITPVAEYTGEFEVGDVNIYYVWAKDKAEKYSNNYIQSFAITKDEAVGTQIILKEADTVLSTFALQGTEVFYRAILGEHYNTLKNYCNDIEIPNDSTKSILENLHYETTCIPNTYLVHFDIGEYGEEVPDQEVVYLHKAEEPTPQYIIGKVVEGWYKEAELVNKWDFTTELVREETQLYAKWIDYHEPSKVTINITEANTEATCWFMQNMPGEVEVDWGDGSEKITTTAQGRISLTHSYANTGEYIVEILCNSGAITLGGGDISYAVIMPANLITNIEFAWNMTSTSNYCLANAVNLTSLTIPRTMTIVSYGICSGCTGLSELNLPDNLLTIESRAFSYCRGLTGVLTIPDSVKAINSYAFENCTGLTKVVLPANDNLTLGTYILYNCTDLQEFTFTENITEIPQGLLCGCSALTEITIPEYVTKSNGKAFAACTSLEYVRIENSNFTTSGEDFNNCPLLKTAGPLDGNYNIEFAWTTSIPSMAFKYGWTASNLTSIVIPSTVTSIGDEAFYYATSLTELNLPYGLNTIGIKAFLGCRSISILTIPFSVTSIGAEAFEWCSFYKCNLYCLSSAYKVETPEVSWFNRCSANTELHASSELNPETAITAFGSCWNYCATTSIITCTYDL